MAIEKKTEGAWIIHHANKLQTVAGAIDFQEIDFAGKCGVLLSALAADKQASLAKRRVEAIAKAAKLNIHTDLPAVLEKLKERQLIDKTETGVEVLGLTTQAVLSHTSDIFQSTEPNAKEQAAINMAEETSRTPVVEAELSKWVADTYQLSKTETTGLLDTSATIGFIDAESVNTQERVFFNGNLFRVDNAKKCGAILTSLSPADRKAMQDLETVLLKKGCIEEYAARKVIGDLLFDKLHSIGVFDVSAVNNEKETTFYITRPGAFSKFGNTLAEDALDLAKAFVSSLTYGMTKSTFGRGKISLIDKLLDKLIRGETLNPSTAAGQDYKILELKGVVEVQPVSGGMFTMRLLKREVGLHAKQILVFAMRAKRLCQRFPGLPLLLILDQKTIAH
jgi:hypothetical protein